MTKRISRPNRIRRVFRQYTGHYLTRAQVIQRVMKEITPHPLVDEHKWLSMALSGMNSNGELESVKLLGCRGYRMVVKA
jgi:hypothetical protein